MSKKLLYGIEEFIDLVKKYPILYNKTGTFTGTVNNSEKNQAWIEIAKRINDDPILLKQKWRNLRDTYQKAVKNRRDLEEIGQLHRYHPYRHEKKLEFLYPHIMAETTPKRKRTRTFPENEEYKIEKSNKKETISYTIESHQDVEYLVEDVSFTDTKRNEEDDNEMDKIEIYKEEQTDEIEQQNTDTLETDSNICYEEIESCNEMSIPEQEVSTRMDDLDMWLSAVKSSLLKLTKINRARAKRDINSILSNYEIEQCEAEDD